MCRNEVSHSHVELLLFTLSGIRSQSSPVPLKKKVPLHRLTKKCDDVYSEPADSAANLFFFPTPSYGCNVHKHKRTFTLKNRVGPTNLEIDEVSTCASLSTGTSPTSKSITPLHNVNKFRKI